MIVPLRRCCGCGAASVAASRGAAWLTRAETCRQSLCNNRCLGRDSWIITASDTNTGKATVCSTSSALSTPRDSSAPQLAHSRASVGLLSYWQLVQVIVICSLPLIACGWVNILRALLPLQYLVCLPSFFV